MTLRPKIQIEIVTPEIAQQLVDSLKVEDLALWEKWRELERLEDGITEIVPQIFKHISSHAVWADQTVPGSLIVAMRKIVYRTVTSSTQF